MRRFNYGLTLLVGLVALTYSTIPEKAQACSRIMLSKNPSHIVISRSLDWGNRVESDLWKFPRSTKSNGAIKENPAFWTSKYGSLVNSAPNYENMGVEGVNEVGFAVHLLYLHETVYESRDQRPGVSYVHWVRYMVDNFATVKEALAEMEKIQIVPVPMRTLSGKILPAHLAMEDSSGDSAIVEYIDGKLVVHHGAEFTVMTNEPNYDVHVANLPKYRGFGGNKNLPGGIEAWERFIRAAYYLKYLPEPKSENESVAFAFQLINNVAVPFGAPYTTGGTYPTWWVSATDVSNKVYYFRSTFSANIVWVELDRLDFTKNTPVMKLEPEDPKLVGDVTDKFAASLAGASN